MTHTQSANGLQFNRRYTRDEIHVFDLFEYDYRSSVIRNPSGEIVFEMTNVEVPKGWSQLATDILAQKYFRKAGVPQPDGSLGRESSARQVVRRLAGCWTDWGRRYGYFDSPDDAAAFDAEITHMLANQMAAPNSPQWFNTGLNYAYGINGPAQGHYYVDPDSKELVQSQDAYTHPQPHACLPYRALVSTPDGPIPMGEIVHRNLVGLSVYDTKSTTPVTAVKYNGVKTVFRVLLKNGNFVEATADHLVLVADNGEGEKRERWVEVSQLKPGMRLIQRTDTMIWSNGDRLAEAEAALAGWVQADGVVGPYSTRKNKSLTVEAMTVNCDEQLFVNTLVSTVLPGAHSHTRSVPSKDANLQIRRQRLYGERLREFVTKYELLPRGVDMDVPAPILNGGFKVVAAYLRALFQADGCVRRKGDSNASDIVFGTTSPKLASGVSQLLNS